MNAKPTSRLKVLIQRIEALGQFPVEIPSVRDQLLAMGIQDRIIFCGDEDMDPKVLRGVYFQYRHHAAVYADPTDVSLIIYSLNVDPAWQRVICCKEMVHICDSAIEKTNTPEEIDGLIDRLLAPMSTEDFDIFDVMAAKDRLALYLCLPLLVPEEPRQAAIRDIKAETKTVEEFAAEACIPVALAKLMLSDDWPSIAKALGTF